eukprot:GHRR01019015.1.p1 GENE.GHRR01019015.1~~GHRR01019015.1.p1  ORF type:complete len:217 (+),score=45.03 GHRR01019015.1:188-838(+)
MLLGAQLHFANVLGSRLTNNVARLLWQCQQKTGRHVQTTAATATGSSSTTDDGGSSSASGRSRVYPDEPRVGVGVVVFRRPITKPEELPEVLLIQRAKEPAKGQWCFPGGSLELGETMAECAAREVFEETGVKIRSNTGLWLLAIHFCSTAIWHSHLRRSAVLRTHKCWLDCSSDLWGLSWQCMHLHAVKGIRTQGLVAVHAAHALHIGASSSSLP